MSDWLAVGDETGDWDTLDNPGAFLGVALVMGRIEDWQAALAETLDDGQQIQERLQAPPRHLPPTYRKSSNHHLMETLDYWKAQRIEGARSLADPGDDPLCREVFATLHWLAEHPRLVTLGLWLQGPGRRDLFRSGDPAVALGRAYGLLAGLVLPFLNPDEDRLLVQPGLRSESVDLPATKRATVGKAQPSTESRQPGDLRGTVSRLMEDGQSPHDAWPGGTLARLEGGTLDHLRQRCPLLKNARLPNNVLNAVADLGAGLLRLSCQQSGTGRLCLHRDEAWCNVVFHALPEVTA